MIPFPHGPPFDPDFLDDLEGRVVTEWRGNVWRAVVDYSNLRRASQRGGRWNPPGLEALYCALTEHGARTELEYLLARQPVPSRAEVSVFPLHVALSRVIDLSDINTLRQITNPDIDYLGEEYSQCQYIGAAVAFLECGGLLIPSARYSGTNLAIFVNKLDVSDVVNEPTL